MFKDIAKKVKGFCTQHLNKRTQPNHYQNFITNSLLGLATKGLTLFTAQSILTPLLVGVATVLLLNIAAGLFDEDGIFEEYLSNGLSSTIGLIVGIIF